MTKGTRHKRETIHPYREVIMGLKIAIGVQDFGDLIEKNTFTLTRHPLSRNGGTAATSSR